MNNFSEDLRKLLLVGIGAVAITAEKSKEVVEDLVKKGELTVEQGKVLNEELKHNISEKIKDNVTVVVEKPEITKEDLAQKIESLSDEDKKEILNLLKKTKKDAKAKNE